MGASNPVVGAWLSARQHCPASLLVIGVTIGQIAGWFCSFTESLGALSIIGVLVCCVYRCPGAFIGGCLLGLMTATLALGIHSPPLDGRDLQLLVRLEEIPTRRAPGEVSFVAREMLGHTRGLVRCRAVDLPWRNTGALQRGDLLWVRGDVRGIERPENPFSWEGWLWRRGIRGEMKVVFASQPVGGGATVVDGVRDAIERLVRDTIGESRGGALFLSMAFGFRDVLSSPVEGMFLSLGLSHLLVVSGYQVSLVFGVVFAAVTRLASKIFPVLSTRSVATGVSFLVASLYVMVVGSEMSALRALIAAACLCAALMLDRRHGFFQRWAVALLIMELLWPWAFFEIGVLLTFAALAGIGVGSLLGGRSRLCSIVWVSVCVWLLTSAIVVMWSGTFSVSGVVLNLFLAGPWSVLNCTVGVVGIMLRAASLWPGREILAFVAFCNEEITRVLFLMSRALGASIELEGRQRLVVSLLFSLASCGCVVAACKRHRVTMATRLAR